MNTPTGHSQRFTALCLRLFIVSVVASALVGASCLAVPIGGWVQLKVFFTTLIIAAASVCGLACGACLALGQRFLPVAGVALTAISAAMGLVGLWGEVHWDEFWRVFGVVTPLAVGCSHASMLRLVRLRASYRLAHPIGTQIVLGLAGVVSAGIGLEFFEIDGYWRLMGVLSIASAAVTLVTPVLGWFSRSEEVAAEESGDPVLRLDGRIAALKKELLELEARRAELLGR